MARWHFIVLIAAVALVFGLFYYVTAVKQAASSAEVVVENLDTPWALDFLPGGKMIFTERSGRVSMFDGKKTTLLAEIPVSESAESGLLGLAVDPKFSDSRYVYVYYTRPGGFNRISRFVFDDGKLKDESVLLDLIPAADFHDGGRLKFGPDGMLYATTGDATDSYSAQDINSLAGKVLRMKKDGSVPGDNPFGNYVWSYGHRNPEGLAWYNGVLYESEHGPNKNDEINMIVEGGNYGWPRECTEQGTHIQPVRCYSDFTLAPSGIAAGKGVLYVGGLRSAQLRKVTIDDSKVLGEEELVTGVGRVRDVVLYKGYLYFTTSNLDGRGVPQLGGDKIMRIKV